MTLLEKATEGSGMTGFLLKRYDVTVSGFPSHPYDAHSPGAARVQSWHSYRSYRDVSFKEFMKISVVRRGTDPEGYGRPILVSGKPAHFVGSNSQYVRFALPGETQTFYSHPLDVSELPATLRAIDTCSGREAE